MSNWTIDEYIFTHRFTCLIVGPTQSGKTFLLKEILKHSNVLFDKYPEKIIYCYSAWQSSFEKFKNEIPNIEFHEGIYNFEELNSSKCYNFG